MRAGCLLLFLLAVECCQPTGIAHAGDALENLKKRGTLIWGADEEGGGPFIYPAADDPNRLEGFEVELAQLIAESLGVKPQFQQGQWDKLPDLLDRGDLDIVLNGYEWSPARAARYGTSIPYYIYELQLLGRKDDPTMRSWQDLRTPSDGVKKRVAVLGGSAANDYIEKNFGDDVEIANFDGVSDAMRAVELNVDGIDANLQDLPIWRFYEPGFPKLEAVGEPVGRGFYVALVRKNEPELLQAVNDALLTAMKDGRLRKILSKYRIWNETQALRGMEVDSAGGFVGPVGAIPVDDDATTPDEEESYIAVGGWNVVWQRGWLLVQAAGMTVLLASTAMPMAILLGLMMALLRLYGPWPLRILSTAYVELIRGTPLVLQLYVLFFLLPEIGITVNAFWAAVAGLALNYSAYEAEIYRAGLQSIPRGQMEAAQALGFSRALALRRIIIPQATRLVIPPVTNDFIALFKDTAVCSVITVVELSKEYYIQARSTGAIIELGLLTAFLYLAMSYPLSLVAARLERRLMPERRT
ncbi:ABC transporter permease subunit [Planctomicrobium piriforme]|uniref:Polar amino acid transport system substrate-binding protein n=1 Tax=Planctomicrobium piriforme TaxID=1576369 RepID=A0A1I3BAY1_9PLAN|nr:ABC transporter permease subunit [Planctomicrobium piriforme]SFH59434.1 polar amino acid transport system substrate-binding protein [Planctomicrobium piriforme]